MHIMTRFLLVMLTLSLMACDRNDVTQPVVPTIERPIAHAGDSVQLKHGATAVLNGSQSYDPKGAAITYQWSIIQAPSGSSSSLSNRTSAFPSLMLDAVGDYDIQLIVNNGREDSLPAKVRISDTDSIPVANAGPDQIHNGTDMVRLDGSRSYDSDGDSLKFQWTLVSAPASSNATLSRADSVYPEFTPDLAGDYEFELIVNDGRNMSTADRVLVSDKNVKPVANAGKDQLYVVGNTLTLLGNNSSDIDNDSLTYNWHVVSAPPGSTATLSAPDQAITSFTPDVSGDYVIALIVNDGQLSSDASTVSLRASNHRPVANAGRDVAVIIGQSFQLDGSGSSDLDGDVLTPTWSITSKPKNSNAILSDTHTMQPSITPDMDGQYVIALTVSDGSQSSLVDSVTASTQNLPPVANAGNPLQLSFGQVAHLNGAASSDPEGKTLSYAWSIISKPSGSSAALSSNSVVAPDFTPDVAGTYVFQLVVNDGLLSSAPSTVVLTDTDLPPVANAGPDQSVTNGTLVSVNGAGSSDPERQPLRYKWSMLTQPTNSTAVLSNNTSAVATFTADIAGDYLLQLTVTDAAGQTSSDTVLIRDTSSNTIPVASAGPDVQVDMGALTTLDGSSSSDADGNTLSYSWSMMSRPSGSAAKLNNANSASPTFTPDVEGDFVFQLVVSDGKSTSFPDIVMVHDTKRNLAPNAVITFTGTNNLHTGAVITLQGGSSSDPNGDVLSYDWQFTPAAGSSASLSSANSATANFTADVAGSYLVSLTVSDGSLTSNVALRLITITVPMQNVLYTLKTTGGTNGIGAWTLLDMQSLNPLKTVDEAKGFISPDPLQTDNTNDRIGASIGMVFNHADGYFYGILPGSGLVYLKNTDEYVFPRDKLIRFEPNTDKLEYLIDIPFMSDGVSPKPFSGFQTVPVISPDGKSLMMVSQSGGKITPSTSEDTIGALVHVNIDSASPDYLKSTPVYEFSGFPTTVDLVDYLDAIKSVPLLNQVNGKYEIFLMSNSSSIIVNSVSKIRKGRAFALSPINSNDWSQPWSLAGAPSTWTEHGTTVNQPYFDNSRKQYVWLVAPYDGSTPGEFYVRKTNPIETTAKDQTIPAKLLGDGTSGGRGLPLAVWGSPYSSLFHYVTQGVPGKQVNIDALGYPRIVEVSSTYVDRYIFPSTFLSSNNPYQDQLFPAGVALSPESGYLYLHSKTDTKIQTLYEYIKQGRSKASSDDYFKLSLSDLYVKYGLRPSKIQRFNYSNFGFPSEIFKGTADDGYVLAGVPAIGSDADGNVARYLVTYAMHGGKYGAGAIIKYDLRDLTYTSIPFGNTTPGYPAGKPIQLTSGKVLGNSVASKDGSLKPQLSSRGVWVQDLQSGASEEFPMPVKDASFQGQAPTLIENYTLVNFAKTENGSIWGVSSYRTADLFSGFVGVSVKPALTQFDQNTGMPLDTSFLDDTFSPVQNIYGVSIRGNLLSFISADTLWFVDVATPAALKKQSIMLDSNNFWDAPFAPTMQTGTNKAFFITLKNNSSDEINIHKVEVDDALSTQPSSTVIVNNLPETPSTPMFEASDGKMYYGTITAKIMRFDPSDDSVTEVVDLSEAGKNSYANGFLSEPTKGVLMGVVVDSTSEELGSGLRGYQIDIINRSILKSFDASPYLSIEDEFPGFSTVNY